MKRLLLLAFAVGCGGLDDETLPPGPWDEDCDGCAGENDLTGEVLLFMNGKPSDPVSGYTTNSRDADGNFVGSAVFLYDPARKGHVVKLGNVLFGPDPAEEEGFQRIAFRNIAYHPEHGLWGLTIEPANDEWRLTRIDVPDFHAHRQLLPQVSYALRTTDAAYWEDDLVGLGFVGDRLFLGGRGDEATGSPGGPLYLTDVPAAHAEDPAYPGDLDFYADHDLTTLWSRFPANLGVAGDICEGEGGELLALGRSEQRAVAPLDINRLFSSPIDAPALDALDLDLPVVRNDDFTGLARVNGVLYAIDVNAKVYALDEAEGGVVLHDDLREVFSDPDNGVRIRGAAAVELP